MTDQFANVPSPDDLKALLKPTPLMKGEPDNFGPIWSRAKLNMPRRRDDLEAYIDRWLAELRTAKPGLVLDIGCGPGDFLGLCKEMGHETLGIDSPDGKDGMGSAYIDLCRYERKRLGVTVLEEGIAPFLEEGVKRIDRFGIPVRAENEAVCVNMRGSIEQCFSGFMDGESHELHNEAKRLDWHRIVTDFRRLFLQSFKLLRTGGIMLISANGTRSTDEWYDLVIRKDAAYVGLELVEKDGFLNHKWVKP
jgi:SAM-dependent methyltransferase